MSEKEHDELMQYLYDWLKLSIKHHPYIDNFMLSPTRKLYNDTFAELLVIDALEAGL